MKNFINRSSVKSIIIATLTALVSISINLLENWNPNQNFFKCKLAFFIITVTLDLLILGYYTTTEVNEKRVNETLKHQISVYKKLLVHIVSICKNSSSEINDCIHNVQAKNKINLKIWSFNKECTKICNLVYETICGICNSENYEVSYIRLIEDDNYKNTVFMNAYANQNYSPPSICWKPRCFDEINESSYHDLELFKRESSNIDIILGCENIKNQFGYNSKIKRAYSKYSQYIGIPIFCDDKKMIGLLQVVSLNNARIGLSKDEIHEIASKYLIPYTHMLLLLHKTERALLVGTKPLNKN